MQKVTWKQARKQNSVLAPGAKKTLKMGSQNRPKIDQNPIPDSDVSFLLLPWSPMMAQGAKIHPQGAKMEAPGLPNDRFWAPKTPESVSKFTIMPKKSDLETNIQEPASQHTFQQRKNKNQEANSQKTAAKTPAAVGEAHKILRFFDVW